jgi:hypothetical protein
VIYPTISECERALDALTLQPAPYDPDYVEGLYSEYTCSDDDFCPEAKGMIGNSSGSSSGESALTGSGYVIDYDSDTLIEAGSYVGDDDIYPLARPNLALRRTLHDRIARRWEREQSQKRSRSANCQWSIHHTITDSAREACLLRRATSRPESWR